MLSRLPPGRVLFSKIALTHSHYSPGPIATCDVGPFPFPCSVFPSGHTFCPCELWRHTMPTLSSLLSFYREPLNVLLFPCSYWAAVRVRALACLSLLFSPLPFLGSPRPLDPWKNGFGSWPAVEVCLLPLRFLLRAVGARGRSSVPTSHFFFQPPLLPLILVWPWCSPFRSSFPAATPSEVPFSLFLSPSGVGSGMGVFPDCLKAK